MTPPAFEDAAGLTHIGFVDEVTLVAYGGRADSAGGLFFVDAESLEIDLDRSLSGVAEGGVKSHALNPDRSLPGSRVGPNRSS